MSNVVQRGIMRFARKGFFNWMSDENFLKMAYWCTIGKKLDLKQPKTYTEKLQWMKLYNRDPMYTKLVDKYEVRKYIKDKLGEKYLFPLLGVWDSFEEIDFSKLPNQFVLKTTHDSGSVVICKNKADIDLKKAQKKLSHSLKHDYYLENREWPYKNVKRRIIAEKFMVDESGTELKDYKFFCFDGQVKALFVATDRGYDTKFDFYDRDFKHLDIKNGHENATKIINRPKEYDKMVAVAEKLSKGIPHVRVDLYNINGKIYFGEMTFFHWSGFVKFEPEIWDETFGEWLRLPEKGM